VRAIDTNVVVRFLVADDPKQALAARKVIENGDLFVPVTVVLETGWVLRAAYGLGPGDVAKGLRGFGGMPGIVIEDAAAVAGALDRMEAGMDFADALHLGRSSQCDAFMTFDRKLAKAAKPSETTPVELLR
jgi:predicted nucleic-acid-binding protein